MLKPLQTFEGLLAKLEARVLTVLVLLMLGFAVYNVLYRNVLVPIQVAADRAANESRTDRPADENNRKKPATTTNNTSIDTPSTNGGFGGGFGDDEPSSDDGFGGGFGDEEPAEEPEDEGFGGGFGEPVEEKPKADDEGFGGGFGSSEDVGLKTDSDAGTGFGGGFGDTDSTEGNTTDESPEEYVEPIQSTTGAVIQAIKLEWIDVLLRHLVLVVGFLGAMLATRRRKHITVDALSKILRGRTLIGTTLATTLLSLIICILLGLAGMDLVALGLEYPKELSWWIDEWQAQLVFPIGFFMLAFHFGVRALEEGVALQTGDDSFLRDQIAEPAVGPPASPLAADADQVQTEEEE